MKLNLEKILSSKTYVNSKNESIKIHSETGLEQCRFLQRIIRTHKCKQSLEIGCAYGISTLAIIEEIAQNEGNHIAIDKFQTKHWAGNGIDLIKSANLDKYLSFYEDYSYIILPRLLYDGIELDFAYIDSTKLIDWLMVDFFYIDKILKINGIVVFDDVDFPSIKKLLRFISQLPNYDVYDTYPKNNTYSKSKLLKIKTLKSMPKSKHYIKNELLNTDFDLGINSSCIALIKTGEDCRKYDWHTSF